MMQPATKADLQRFTPHALPEYLDVLIAGAGAMSETGITANSLRWCHFLGQIAAETGGMRLVREDTRWTGERMKAIWPRRFPLGKADPRILAAKSDPRKLANLAYSNRADIGNRGGDDGWLYRGGGPFQLTGRDAYRECGAAIGVDLENMPDEIESPAVGLSAAIWVWGHHPNNGFADHNYGRAIGNAINRGNPYSRFDPIGYAHRRQWFERGWAIFVGGQPPPSDETLHLGAHGPKVLRVQMQLRARGYPLGAEDGVFGPAMARAVAGFKLDQKREGRELEADEAIGPLTLAAIEDAGPAPLSPERTTATEHELAAAGSTEVATGQRAKAVGQATLYTGLVAGADKVGLVDQLTSSLSGINALHLTIVPAIHALQWGLKHIWWVALIVGGVWGWKTFGDVVLARLRAHQNGSNLGR